MKVLSVICILTFALSLQITEIHDVIIIGAGISGLRASQILKDKQIPHLILESTDHIGGRITSMEFQGLKVDKGASFIHNSKTDNPLGKIVEDRKLPWINGTCSYRVTYQEGEKQVSIPHQDIIESRKMYFKLVDMIGANLEKAKDISISEVTKGLVERQFPKQAQIRKRLVNFMFKIQGNIDGAEISKLSAKQRSYKDTTNDIMLKTGFHQFFKLIFSDIGNKVLFKQRVHTIDYSSQIIKVSTNSQVFYAKKVISSLPLGILKAGKVKFIPTLPKTHQESINNIGNGYADKLFVSFKKPFWGDKKGWLSFLSKDLSIKYPVAFIIPSQEKHILIIFVSGDSSLKISKWTDREIIDDLENSLSMYFHPSQIKIQAVKLTRWHMDQNTLGSYSHYKVGTTENDFTRISKPIDDKLWFIGEHTNIKMNSYAHGAYLTGEDAANQVTQSFKNKGNLLNKAIKPINS